jgi:hypothetical protein
MYLICIIVLILIYLMFRRYIVNTIKNIPSKFYKNNIIPIVDISRINSSDISLPQAITYDLEFLSPTIVQFFNEQGNKISTINDYDQNTYVKLSRSDIRNDINNRYLMFLKLGNLKVSRLIKNNETFSEKLEPLLLVNNIYIKFYNELRSNNKTYSEGDYRINIRLLNNIRKRFEEDLFTNFTLNSTNSEVLLTFKNPLSINSGKNLLIGIRKLNDDFVYISEVLINFQGSFIEVQKKISIINENLNIDESKIIPKIKKIDRTIQPEIKVEVIQNESILCPPGHSFLNTGNVSSSRCVKYCDNTIDCIDAMYETGVNTNNYKIIENPECINTDLVLDTGKSIRYCVPK